MNGTKVLSSVILLATNVEKPCFWRKISKETVARCVSEGMLG